MTIRNNFRRFQSGLSLGLFLSLAGITNSGIAGQTPTATPAAAASQLGTVKAVSGNTITMTTDKGLTLSVSVATGAKVVELAVGSTDLKTAKPSQLTDVAVGDRALVTGKVGDTPESFTAARVILMKSADIAQKQAAQQDDWKARGTSGTVSTVDPVTGIITITSGTKKVAVNTSSKTEFRRFAGDTVKYQDAKLGTLAQIQPKDQLQARGTKSPDGTSMQAEEVISGSFENLSGMLLSVDSPGGKITLKDLASKKIITVNVTANSDLRTMPAMMATRFAAQANGGGQGGERRGGGNGGGTAQETSGGSGRSAGADLSQMIARLPTITLADLHKGDAVMIVASESAPGATTVTAVTMLSGVDAILTANPNGGMDLSMSVSSGGSE